MVAGKICISSHHKSGQRHCAASFGDTPLLAWTLVDWKTNGLQKLNLNEQNDAYETIRVGIEQHLLGRLGEGQSHRKMRINYSRSSLCMPKQF